MSTEAAYTYISDLIQTGDSFSPHCLNLIAAGCGAGKSYFVARHLPKLFPAINPCDMLFVTSRSITVDQQAREYQGSVLKYDPTLDADAAGRTRHAPGMYAPDDL